MRMRGLHAFAGQNTQHKSMETTLEKPKLETTR